MSDTFDLSVFDISEFGFGSFGWGDTLLTPAGNKLKEFSMDVDLRPDRNLICRTSGKLDTLTGIVTWNFLSLNPENMNIEEDPLTGFLPPNATSPEGEGFVSFSIGLNDELTTYSEIRNKATIVFDANEPIITNEYLNTLDIDMPQSQVNPLESNTNSNYMVSWEGSDAGSGISHFTICVLENDTLLYEWLINTRELSADFIGKVGSTYKFYSIATDNVSLREDTPDGFDTQTTITVDVETFEQMKKTLIVWPNPLKNNLNVQFNNAPCGMYVVELINANGLIKHSMLYEDIQLQKGLDINVADFAPGTYILRVVFGNKAESRKVMIH